MKVGFELHVTPLTESKMYCDCPTKNAQPNLQVCPICTGQPGSKPMAPNETALRAGIKLAKALNCTLNESVSVMRKHYFYPDLPNNYQLTSEPFGENGSFNNVGITEIHFEEDPGQYDPKSGLVDLNRSGSPLLEVVTEPDIDSIEKARDFLEEFSALLGFLGISQKIKADTNVSINGGARVEVKNIGSISGALNAIQYEVNRQAKEGAVLETRHYDKDTMTTKPARLKETVADYRYMREPNLPTIHLGKLIKETPEPPKLDEIRQKLVAQGLTMETARIITSEKWLYDLFNNVNMDKAELAKFLRRDLLNELKYRQISFENSSLDVQKLEQLLNEGISPRARTEKLRALLDNKAVDVTEASHDDLEKAVDAVLEIEAAAVEKYKNGKKNLFNYFLGEVDKKLGHSVKPGDIARVLKKKLGS